MFKPVLKCVIGVFISYFVLSSGIASATESIVFGPETYIRSSGTPETFTDSFDVTNPSGQFRMEVLNGEWGGEGRIEDAVSSARIYINGLELVSTNDFNQTVAVIEREIPSGVIEQDNVLEVWIASAPGSKLTITIFGTDQEPPVTDLYIPAIFITSPSDKAKTNNATPTITLSYKDLQSGINQSSFTAEMNGQDISSLFVLGVNGGEYQVSEPLPDGPYSLKVGISDNAGNLNSDSIAFEVDIARPDETVFSGFIEGYVYNRTSDEPLEGVTVTGRDAILNPLLGRVLTDANGHFSYPTSGAGEYYVDFNMPDFTYAQRKAVVETARAIGVDPVYLVPLDPEVTTITPSGGTHTDSRGHMQIIVPSGAINYNIDVRATEIDSFVQLPTPLPDSSVFTYCFELEPHGQIFSLPVTFRIKNYLGFDPGDSIPVGFFTQEQGEWEEIAMAYVQPDGEWIEYEANRFSWHDCNDAPPPKPKEPKEVEDNSDDHDQNQDVEHKDCLASGVSFRTGNLQKYINLPPVKFLNRWEGLSFTYNSNTTKPSFLVDYQANLYSDARARTTSMRLYFEDEVTERVFAWESVTARFAMIKESKNYQGEWLPSGTYPWSLIISNNYDSLVYWNTKCFGCGPINPTRVYVRQTTPSPLIKSGAAVVNNQRNSPYGAGWGIDGLFKITGKPGDSEITVQEGSNQMSKMSWSFIPFCIHDEMIIDTITWWCDTLGCRDTIIVDTSWVTAYDSVWAYNDTSYSFWIETNESENPFLLRERDGTEILFDSLGQMVKRTYPNDIIYEYIYNDLGLLVEIIDPLGRSITLEYDNFNHLHKLTDQVGRITLFNISPENGLLSVTFPDGSSRSFEYDDLLLTSEIDQNGHSTEYIYKHNRIHQINGPACCNGILATFEPSNTHGIINDLPPGFGTDSLPAQLFLTENIFDVKIGARNDTTLMKTNKAGKATYIRDAVGNETRYSYDSAGRLISLSRLGSGYVYEYDGLGQIRTQRDYCGGSTNFLYSYENDFCLPMLASITDGNHNTESFLYDGKGQKTAYIDAKEDTTFYSYNSHGLLETIVNPFGDSTIYRYDSTLNSCATIFNNGDSIAFVNDSIGNLIESFDPAGYPTQYEYDVMGRLKCGVDPLGGLTKYIYDAKGNLLSLTDPLGHTTAYKYDGRSRLIWSENPLGDSTIFIYDKADNLIQKITPNGDTIRFEYDLVDQLIQKSYPEDTVLYQHDSRGNLISMHNRNTVNDFEYNSCDNLTMAVTDSAYALLYDYDLAGNRTSMELGVIVETPGLFKDPVSSPTGVGPNMSAVADFNNDGFVDLAVPNVGSDNISILLNNGNGTFASPINYDFGISDPGVVVVADFNKDNCPDLAVLAWYYVYIALNNGDGTFGTAKSYSAGTLPAEADTGDFDKDGDIDLAVVDFHDGLLLLFNDGTGVFSAPVSYSVGSRPWDVTSGDFDQDGDLDLAVVNYSSSFISVLKNYGDGTFAPAVNHTSYIYGSQITNADFNADGYPDLAITYWYYTNYVHVFPNNGDGTFASRKSYYGGSYPHWLTAEDLNDDGLPDLVLACGSSTKPFSVLINNSSGGFLTANTYSGNCGIRAVTTADINADNLPDIIGSGYSCDIIDVLFNGALIPDIIQTNKYEYNSQNRVTDIVVSNESFLDSIDISMTYDKLGRMTSTSLHNGPHTTYEYDNLSRLTRLQNDFNGSPVSYYEYEYDKRRNRNSMTDIDGTHEYAYDECSQLLTATHSNPILPDEFYAYDAVGNRLSSHLSVSYSYDAANRLLEDDNYTYSYDKNGNLIQKTHKTNGNVSEFDFDAENKLVGFRNLQGGVVTDSSCYKYDGSGRRVEKCVNGMLTKYVYDREDIVMELDSAGAISAYYVHGPGIDNPLAIIRDSSLYCYLKDGLGSIVQVVDAVGNGVLDYVYDSYGNIKQFAGALTNPYTYTGREYDSETGQYYYRARYYDAAIGRFTSVDPVSRISEFSYADNNPIIKVDPSGLDCVADQAFEAIEDVLENVPLDVIEAWVTQNIGNEENLFFSGELENQLLTQNWHVNVDGLTIDIRWYIVGRFSDTGTIPGVDNLLWGSFAFWANLITQGTVSDPLDEANQLGYWLGQQHRK